MIGALVSGTLANDPQERATKSGNPMAVASLRVSAGAEALFVSVTAFDSEACARLLALRKGSSVSAAGALEATVWTGSDGAERKGWRLTAVEVLSAYQANKRRAAAAPAPDVAPGREAHRMWGDGLPESPL